MLELTDVTVRYGDLAAVDDVWLTLVPGEVLAVLGPSGCGKSTLLRAVAGLEPLAHGRVAWDGRDLSAVPTHERGFALMFQDGQLFAHATVSENVAYPLRLRRTPRAERRARVEELLGLVGLGGFADRRPATLSGGQQQRVALARSLAAEPRLLLLDEPLSALDRSLREQLAGDLREILTATGTTAMLVTHDHDEAFTVADRTAVMLAGRIAQVGPTPEVWRAPASADVAAFVGYPTLLEGPAGARVLGAVRTDSVGRDSVGTDAVGTDARAGGTPYRIALRRSALRVDPGGALTGRVVRAVAVSDAVHLVVDVEGVGECAAVAPDAATVAPGDEVRLAVDPRGVAQVP